MRMYCIALVCTILIASCKKWSTEKLSLAAADVPVAQPISDAALLCGSIKGTMLEGKAYTIGCDVTINAGDTLTIQPGVHINVKNKAGVFLQGSLVSHGTKAKQGFITVY